MLVAAGRIGTLLRSQAAGRRRGKQRLVSVGGRGGVEGCLLKCSREVGKQPSADTASKRRSSVTNTAIRVPVLTHCIL